MHYAANSIMHEAFNERIDLFLNIERSIVTITNSFF